MTLAVVGHSIPMHTYTSLRTEMLHSLEILNLYNVQPKYSAVPLKRYVWDPYKSPVLQVNCFIKGQFYKGIIGK